MYRPVVFAAGMLIAGIILSESVLPAILILIILYSFFINKGKENTLHFIVAFILHLLIFSSIFLLGVMLGEKKPLPVESYLSANIGKELYVEGIVDDAVTNQNGQRLTVSVSSLSLNNEEKSFNDGKIYVYTDYCEASVNDTIVFVSEIEIYKNAYNEGGFDSKSYYSCRGIFGYAYPERIEIKNNGESDNIGYWLYYMKVRLIDNLLRIFNPNDAGILIAILTGEKTYMVEEISDLYRDSGFAHVLAISGLHISLIGLSLFKLLRGRKLAFIPSTIFTLLLLCIYNSFSGGQVSCRRAIIMICLSLVGRCMGRRYDMLTGLAVSAIIILISQPGFIYDSSFIMSYSAALGISTIGQVLNRAEIFEEERVKKAIKSVLFSVAVQVAILPSQIEFFNKFCPYSLIINVFLLPLISIPVVSGFASAAIACFSVNLAELVALPAKLVLFLYEKTMSFTGKLPMAEIVTGHMTKEKWMIVGVIILSFVLISKYGKEIYAFWCLVPAVFLVIPFHESKLKISSLYVGQGDCHIITYEDYAIMIDCGSSDEDELFRYTVEPYLRYNGYSGIDYIFLSHTDEDHVSGFLEFLDTTDKSVTVFVPELEQKDFHALFSVESEENKDNGQKNIRKAVIFKEIICGSSARLGELVISCVYPDEANNALSQNETSMVLMLEYNDFSMLFTGDVSGIYEEKIVDNIVGTGIEQDIDVLKVSHHGSRYSTKEKFLELVNPEFAVISCGIDNMYNHPADELIIRLEKKEVQYYVTSMHGQVTIECNEESEYNIITFLD